MARFRLDLTIPEWEGEDVLDAVNSFLDSNDGPWWEQLEWTVTDLENGMTFNVALCGADGPEVSIEVANGERVPLDRVEGGTDGEPDKPTGRDRPLPPGPLGAPAG